MKRLFSAFSLLFLFASFDTALAQTRDKHFVYFRDKANSPYALSKPEQFLSSAALKRRKRQNIALNLRDLPVSPAYVSGLKALGVNVRYKSKWLNGAIIECDSAKLIQVLALPFVKSGQTLNRALPGNQDEKDPIEVLTSASNERKTANPLEYGESFTQADMIGATDMHDMGFHGEGMTVAVFDNGFPGVNNTIPFAHLYQNKQLKGVYNFVTNSQNVYSRGGHGTQTLSNIAGYQLGKFIGTAYKANVYLFVTEDDGGEYPIEEANWLIAAEFADSAGVDVINSSLGYSTFDDPRYNHSYADMDGNTTIVTRVLAVPSLAFGLTTGLLPDWFDGHELTPTAATSVLGTGVALVGGIVTYGAWRHTTALAARVPMGAVAAHPEGDAGLVEAEAIASHTPAYGNVASAPDPADPSRLLLGPLHRHAAVGFHLDAVYATH